MRHTGFLNRMMPPSELDPFFEAVDAANMSAAFSLLGLDACYLSTPRMEAAMVQMSMPADFGGLNMALLLQSEAPAAFYSTQSVVLPKLLREYGPALGLLYEAVRAETGIPYPLKKTARFPIAAPPYTERICYVTFKYRAGYTAENHCYAIETVLAAFREYTPFPFLLPAPLRPAILDEGKDAQGRKKGPFPSEDRLIAKALDLAKTWQKTSELGRYYQAGKCPSSNVMFKGEEEVCAVTPHSEATLARRSAPVKKAKQPTKPAAGVPARGRGGDGAMAGGGAFGSRAGLQPAVAAEAAAATREQQHARRRGGPGQNWM
eukprot:jgi/Tetstr1/455961/TSEL_042742.t1